MKVFGIFLVIISFIVFGCEQRTSTKNTKNTKNTSSKKSTASSKTSQPNAIIDKARVIQVKSNVPLEQILLGSETLKLSENNKIEPGKYQIKATKSGYKPFSKEFSISSGKDPFVIEVELTPALRKLEIKLGYKVGAANKATANIAFLQQGKTVAIKNDEIAPGDYLLRISQDGYQTVEKKVSVAVGADPFSFNAKLSALPRKLDLKLVSTSSASIKADKVLIDGKPVTESVAAGNHVLVVEKKGYKKVEQKLEVKASSQPFSHSVTLSKATLDPVKIGIDVVSKDGKNLKADRVLVGGKLLTGKLVPGEYEIIVEKEGYRKFQKKYSIDSAKVFKVTLELLPRRVKFIFVDSETNKPLTPTVKLNNKAVNIGQEQSLSLGKYQLDIQCPGYKATSKEVQISQGKELLVVKYTLEKDVTKKARAIELTVVSDAKPNETFKPVMFNIGNDRYMQGKKMVPGTYKLFIHHEGHSMYTQKIIVPPGDGVFKKKIVLESSQRNVRVYMDYDKKPADGSEPKGTLLHTTSGQKVLFANTMPVKPGMYKIQIEQQGYKFVGKGQVFISPGKKPYKLKIQMQKIAKAAVLCQVALQISSNFPRLRTPLTPTIATLNGTAIGPKNKFKAGEYEFVLKIPGYGESKEKISIPSTSTHTIRRVLKPKPRKVIFKVIADHPKGLEVKPDKVLVNDKEFTGELAPGDYLAILQKAGYRRIYDKISIKVGDAPQIITRQMTVDMRQVKFTFVDDKTAKELQPDEVKLNGQKFDTSQQLGILPGNYNVEITKKKYLAATKKIAIEPGKDVFSIKIAITRDKNAVEERKVVITVFSDANAKTSVVPSILSINNKNYTPKMLLKPGKHEVVAYLKNHQMYTKTIEITSGSEEFHHKVILESKLRELKCKIEYDIKPSSEFIDAKGGYKVRLTHGGSNKEINPLDSKKIKPGIYKITASLLGYEYRGKKEVFITPTNEPFTLAIKFFTKQKKVEKKVEKKNPKEEKANTPAKSTEDKERVLVIHAIHPEKNTALTPLQIFVDEKPYNNTPLKTGKEVNLKVLFKAFATYRARIPIKKGSGVFEFAITPNVLKKFTFYHYKNGETLDGIKYPYSFFIDKNKPEEHLMKAEYKNKKNYYYLWISTEAKVVNIYAGYKYTQKGLIKETESIGRTSKIDAKRLTKHIDQLRKKLGEKKAITAFQKIVSRYFIPMRKWTVEDKEHLLEYAGEWEPEEEATIPVHEKIMQKLERFED